MNKILKKHRTVQFEPIRVKFGNGRIANGLKDSQTGGVLFEVMHGSLHRSGMKEVVDLEAALFCIRACKRRFMVK